jgi:hypothetical protein
VHCSGCVEGQLLLLLLLYTGLQTHPQDTNAHVLYACDPFSQQSGCWTPQQPPPHAVVHCSGCVAGQLLLRCTAQKCNSSFVCNRIRETQNRRLCMLLLRLSPNASSSNTV